MVVVMIKLVKLCIANKTISDTHTVAIQHVLAIITSFEKKSMTL